jgi:tripartite-type tricarboxylate transporter receptor subunit TctC
MRGVFTSLKSATMGGIRLGTLIGVLLSALNFGGEIAFCQTASSYPERTVRLVVPFPAGGAVDIVARAFAEQLSAEWKQPVIVENVAGASGGIAAAQVARAPNDGYTLLAAVGTNTSILKALKPKVAFDPINDFTPISLFATFPNLLVVRPGISATNATELIALARGAPGKLTFASSGYGSSLHLAGEMFKLMSKTDLLHVPFTGSTPVTTALLGGHVDMVFDTMPSNWSAVQAGALRAIGVASKQRAPGLDKIASISDALPGYDVTTWEGILAPAGTPAAIVDKIAAAIQRVAQDPNFGKRMLDIGAVVASSTPAEFSTFIHSDYAKWKGVVSEAGLKIE